ncbi:hypothetical protein PIB30_005639 [Stylosanthes scabra]|uniref:Uncharacterized protein n=1 Tax=Stylosanthes scabra TaxID=79078 RepID=A0ABU6T3V8_9FABA|nr:hypothetical protein [Stylosanthes scabra]
MALLLFPLVFSQPHPIITAVYPQAPFGRSSVLLQPSLRHPPSLSFLLSRPSPLPVTETAKPCLITAVRRSPSILRSPVRPLLLLWLSLPSSPSRLSLSIVESASTVVEYPESCRHRRQFVEFPPLEPSPR